MNKRLFEQDVSLHSGIPKVYSNLKNKSFDDWEIPPWELYIDSNKKIGEGTWANVYLAEWRQTKVVAKVLKNINDLHAKKLIIKEFQNMTKMHHPNIVQLFGYVEEPFVIVMEYFKNGDLYENLLKLKLSKKIKIANDILQGLIYIHERKPAPLIHRDIKLRNILLTNSYTAKISDFGLSTFSISNIMKTYSGNDLVNLVNSKENKRENEIIIGNGNRTGNDNEKNKFFDLTDNVGTLRYMAPEIKTGYYNSKVDIYSCGILFYELFTNKPVYDNIINYRYININLSKELTLLILKMIGDDPNIRPTSSIVMLELNRIKFKETSLIKKIDNMKIFKFIQNKSKLRIGKVN